MGGRTVADSEESNVGDALIQFVEFTRSLFGDGDRSGERFGIDACEKECDC